MGVVAAGHPLTRAGRCAGAARRRQRGRRGARGDAHLVRRRAAADGPWRGRLHAGRGRRRSSRRCSTSSCRRRAIHARSDGWRPVAELQAIDVSFGDAAQVFHIGPASCGAYGAPAGVCEAARRWGTVPLAELAAPAARLARDGVALNAEQAYVAEILADLLTSTPECAALWAPGGHVLREGEMLRNPDLGEALELLGTRRRRAVLSRRDRARGLRWLGERGGWLALEDLAGYDAVERAPVEIGLSRSRGADQSAAVRGRDTGRLRARRCSTVGPRRRRCAAIVEAMVAAQSERTPEFLEGLSERGLPRALPRQRAWARPRTSR